jgi:hypothetical protein
MKNQIFQLWGIISGQEIIEVLLLYELGYVVPCMGILTEGKFCIIVFEFHTGI